MRLAEKGCFFAMGSFSESRASDSPLGTTSEDGGAAATRHLITHVTAGPGAPNNIQSDNSNLLELQVKRSAAPHHLKVKYPMWKTLKHPRDVTPPIAIETRKAHTWKQQRNEL